MRFTEIPGEPQGKSEMVRKQGEVMTRLRRLLGLIVCGSLMWAAPATADTVTDWNAIATTAISAGARPTGAAPLLDFAMVHAAMHDAVQAYEKRFEPYAVDISNATGSRNVAVAKAAQHLLAARFSTQSAGLQLIYEAYLLTHSLPLADFAAEGVGRQAADGIIALRANDGSYPIPPPPPYVGGTGAGQWRPTPPALAPFSSPWLGAVQPFTSKYEEQFRALPQPALTSHEYARDYNEVKRLGCLTCNDASVGGRTPEQTDLAHFYSDNTIVLIQRTLRGIIEARPSEFSKLGDSARLMALANLAAADAGLTAWDSKKFYNFWRPITAIQQLLPADNDGNPQTAANATWVPLITTPPYGDYTSGANSVVGSIMHTLALFFRNDKMTFTVTSNASLAVQKTRTYTRCSEMADDLVEVRILQGIHFRFADTAARRAATRVAHQAFHHFLRPLHGAH
jgi:hypothetical protein